MKIANIMKCQANKLEYLNMKIIISFESSCCCEMGIVLKRLPTQKHILIETLITRHQTKSLCMQPVDWR